MTGRLLRTAERLYRRRDYPGMIRLLEPQVYRYREDHRFYYLLGVACLHTGDIGGAYSYLLRSDQLQRSLEATVGLAAIHCRRGEVEQALTLWLQVVEQDPRNRAARYGLALTRRGGDAVAELRTDGLAHLLPRPPIRWGPVVAGLFVVAVGASAVILGPSLVASARERLAQRAPAQRPGVEEVNLSGANLDYVAPDRSARLQLSSAQVEAAFELAKRNLRQFSDNAAPVEINRILNSNATTGVKERARQLQAFVSPPDFSTLTSSYSYRQVRAEPWLYDAVYVRWSGKVANLSVGQDRISFELLVGYQDERVLEGSTSVFVEFPALLRDGMALEILGQIVVSEPAFQVRATGLHELGPAGA